MFGQTPRRYLFGLCALALFLGYKLSFGRQQVLTGDEPRYLMYAVSILQHGRFVMTLDEWRQLYLGVAHMPTDSLPTGGGGIVLMHGVYLPILLSPVALAFSLPGLRFTTLLAGLIGLFYLFRLCRRFASPRAALLTTTVAGLSIPLLPYLHLFYMETYLFALVCCGWDRLQDRDRTAKGDLVTAIALLAIPFVHLRGVVLAAALYLLLLRQLYERGATKRAMALAALAVAAMLVLAVLNFSIYGAVTGPVNTARPPLPAQWFSVLAMQLFNVRHGLIAYAPVWLLGYAGLWLGAFRGPSIARQGLVLAAVAAVTSVGVNPGECWPARFWVLAIPMLAVGFCAWWSAARQPLLKLAAVLLIGLTLINSFLFFRTPNDFLENRQTTTTYQRVFDTFGRVHFGLPLPVEVDDAPDLAAARTLAIGSALFILAVAVAAGRRPGAAFAVPAFLLVVAAIDLARVGIVPPADYETSIAPDRLAVQPHIPIRAAYLQFGHSGQTWFTPPDWTRFGVTVTGANGGQTRALLSANQVMAASCAGTIDRITIDVPGGFDIGAQAQYRLVLYRSNSLLRNSLGFLRGRC